MRIHRPTTRNWFTALKLCDPPATCITASVRPCIGRMLPISSGSCLISGDADCRLFASTVFWPLTLKLNTTLGWRDTYLVYGVLQLAICFCPACCLQGKSQLRWSKRGGPLVAKRYSLREVIREPLVWKLACGFATKRKYPMGIEAHRVFSY